jgi:hypothetical protein
VFAAPSAPHGVAAHAEHEHEGHCVESRRADEPVRADVCRDQKRAAVERGPRTARPLRDLASSLTPDEVDEERDSEQKADLCDERERDKRLVQLENDDRERDERDDDEPAQRGVHVGDHPPHAATSVAAGVLV